MNDQYEYVLSIFSRNNINDCLKITSSVKRCFLNYTKNGKYEYIFGENNEQLRLSTNAFTRSLLPIIRYLDTPFKLAILTSGGPTEMPFSFELYVDPLKFKELRKNTTVKTTWEITLLYALDRHMSNIYVSPPIFNCLSDVPMPMLSHSINAPSSVYQPRPKRRRVSIDSKWQDITITCKHPIGSSGYSFYLPPRYTIRIAQNCIIPSQQITIRGRVLCGSGLARNDLVTTLLKTLNPPKQKGVGPLGDNKVWCAATLLCVPRHQMYEWRADLDRANFEVYLIFKKSDFLKIAVKRLPASAVIVCTYKLIHREIQSCAGRLFEYNHNAGASILNVWWNKIIVDDATSLLSIIDTEIVPMLSEIFVTDYMLLLTPASIDVLTVGVMLPLLTNFTPVDVNPGFALIDILHKCVDVVEAEPLATFQEFVRFVDLDVACQLVYNRFVDSGASNTKLVQYCCGVDNTTTPFQLLTLEEALLIGIRYHDKRVDAAKSIQLDMDEMGNDEVMADNNEGEGSVVIANRNGVVILGGDGVSSVDNEEDDNITDGDNANVANEDEESDDNDEEWEQHEDENEVDNDDEDNEDNEDEDEEEETQEEESENTINEDENDDNSVAEENKEDSSSSSTASNNASEGESKEDYLSVNVFHVGTSNSRHPYLNMFELNLIEEMENGNIGSVEQNEKAAKLFTDCVDALTDVSVAPICSICYNLSVNALTTCGHLFCSACISRLERDTSPCPFCRALLKPYNIFHLKSTIFTNATNVPCPTVEVTKLGLLTTLLLNSSRREHVIVLVQWKAVGKYICKQLQTIGVRVKLLVGTDKQVYNALQWFDMSTGDVARVLIVLVSPLTRVPRVRIVNTVVLFHPIVCATTVEQHALESAALITLSTFRTPSTTMVKVHRFVTNNTIESQLEVK